MRPCCRSVDRPIGRQIARPESMCYRIDTKGVSDAWSEGTRSSPEQTLKQTTALPGAPARLRARILDGAKMTFLMAGVSCVGKTAVGESLARLLGVPFLDLDQVVERQLGAPIARLQERCGTTDRFREKAAGVLADMLCSLDGRQAIIALPPSGLMGPYWRQLKGRSVVTVVLEDKAENILERVRFFDADSRPIQKTLTARERVLYLREIRRDIAYFGRSYRKADLHVAISGCSVTEAAGRVRDALVRVARSSEPDKSKSGLSSPPCSEAVARFLKGDS